MASWKLESYSEGIIDEKTSKDERKQDKKNEKWGGIKGTENTLGEYKKWRMKEKK
jgi:hypothetical protein